MEYLSIKQTAEKWAIPADTKKPVDQRIKSGKYMKDSVG